MFIDKELLLCSELDLGDSFAAGSLFSSNAIDLGSLRDVGKGRQMYVVITVDEDFAAASAMTMQFNLIEEDTVASPGVITLDTNSPVLLSTEPFSKDVLTTKSAPIVIPIPPGIALRYIGLECILAGATSTAGKITAFVALEAQTNV